MRFRTLCVATLVVLASVASTQAETTTWDAYTEFNSTANSASNTWSYYNVAQGANTGYGLNAYYQNFPDNTFSAWNAATNFFPSVGTNGGEVVVQPSDSSAAVIGWNSPITGTVKASFLIHDLDSLGKPGDDPVTPLDGVKYYLFKSNDPTIWASGYVANNGTSGMIDVDIAVTSDDMLYLQVGRADVNYWCDMTGVSFTVSEVPEPSSIALLVCGLLGLMAYAWRKRK